MGRNSVLVCLLFALALVTTSCGKNPVAPQVNSDPIFTTFVQFTGTLPAASMHGVLVTENTTSTTANIVVLKDDTLQVGKFTAQVGARACWAGNGQAGILFDDGPNGSTIWGSTADGANRVAIVQVDGAINSPMVSADGKVFVYLLHPTGNDTLYVVRHTADKADGGERRWPVTHGQNNSEVSIAADGKAVFYTAYDSHFGQVLYGLWFDGSSPRVVTYPGNYRAALNPAGPYLVYGEGSQLGIRLFSARLDTGTHESVATAFQAGDPSNAYGDAAYSPAGSLYIIHNGQLENRTSGRALTTGPVKYSWPLAQ